MKKIILHFTLSLSLFSVLYDTNAQSLACKRDGIIGGVNSILAEAPNYYTFAYDGGTGDIDDGGGDDMYDGANELNTNLKSYIEYTSGNIVSDSSFGDGGTHFTLQLPGLFVLVAELDSIDYFFTSGGNGADGSGIVDDTSFTFTNGGITYAAFVKRIYNSNDPSINHLFIVPQNAAVTHGYNMDSNNDADTIMNLNASTELYYLLFSSLTGTGFYSGQIFENVANEFINSMNANLVIGNLTLDNQYCFGETINVPFDACSPLNNGNTITVELSDKDGDFSNPTDIGSLTTNAAGIVNATLPNNLPNGSGYKVRVKSDNPVYTSTSSQSFGVKEMVDINSTYSIASGTSATLSANNSGSYAWFDNINSTTPIAFGDSYTTPVLNTNTTYYVTHADTVAVTINTIDGLNSSVIDHDAITGDDRGGIAITNDYLFVVGDNNTGRYNLELGGGIDLPIRDGIFSDLSSGQLYTLWDTASATDPSNGSGTFDAIREMDDSLNFGNIIYLSQPISNFYGGGIFAGFGFLYIHNDNDGNTYKIELPSGTVSLISSNTINDFEGSENWADWGIVQEEDTVAYLIYKT